MKPSIVTYRMLMSPRMVLKRTKMMLMLMLMLKANLNQSAGVKGSRYPNIYLGTMKLLTLPLRRKFALDTALH